MSYQHHTTHCNTLQHTHMWISHGIYIPHTQMSYWHSTTHCNTLKHTPTFQKDEWVINTVQHTTTHTYEWVMNTAQPTTTHYKTNVHLTCMNESLPYCNALQHTTTRTCEWDIAHTHKYIRTHTYEWDMAWTAWHHSECLVLQWRECITCLKL